MASQTKTPKAKPVDVGAELVGIKTEIAGIQAQLASSDPAAAILELKAQLAEIQAGVVAIQAAVPGIVARAPKPLTPEEVEKLVSENPAVKLKALSPHRRSRLALGEVFEPRQKFSTPGHFVSLVRGGDLRVARAA